jgi:signal transduction histidine kinase
LYRQDWAFIALRLLIAAAPFLLAPWMQAPVSQDPEFFQLPLLLAGIATLAAVMVLLVPSLRSNIAGVLVVGDWAFVAALAMALPTAPMPLMMAVTTLTVLGMLRFGFPYGLLALGQAVVVVITLMIVLPGADFSLSLYRDPALVYMGIALVLYVWTFMRAKFGGAATQVLRKQLEQKNRDVDEMRKGQKLVVEMALSLSTQSYDKILDTALDIGRLGLRRGADSPTLSMVLLFRAVDDSLAIVNARGITHIDTDRVTRGKKGLIEQALREAQPLIGGPTSDDPELNEFRSLARTRSTLVVPLRSDYVNYGVLVFTSFDENAFNSDSLELLTAIGTQVTVAMQNASLYSNLLSEKERILRLETNARQSLVRDLHDIPTQTISAVTMRVGIIKLAIDRGRTLDDIKDELNAVEELAQQATAEIRHVLFKLRPLALESQGLSVALNQLVDKTRKTYQVNVVLKVDSAVDQVLPDDAQDALFYLIEEAISNARKYAKAPLVRVDVAVRPDQVVVRVADNGAGFNVEDVKNRYSERGSFGIVNMEERAELIGGRLNLQSQPGKGTVITISVPLNVPRPDSTEHKRFKHMKIGNSSSR